MRRNAFLLAAAALAAAGYAASLSLAAHAAQPTVRAAFDRSLGKSVLVNAGGLTLYRNSREKHRHVACTGGCAAEWPPLLVAAGTHPLAGPGVGQSMLGTVRRPDGRTQVTYGGWPLYRFAGDAKAGDTKGQGLEGIWFAVTLSGGGTSAPPASSPRTSYPAGTTSSTEPTGTTSTGYGYP